LQHSFPSALSLLQACAFGSSFLQQDFLAHCLAGAAAGAALAVSTATVAGFDNSTADLGLVVVTVPAAAL